MPTESKSETPNDQLKPCPFCGCVKTERDGVSGTEHREDCYLILMESELPNSPLRILAWNNRPYEKELNEANNSLNKTFGRHAELSGEIAKLTIGLSDTKSAYENNIKALAAYKQERNILAEKVKGLEVDLQMMASAKFTNELNCKEQIDTLAKENHKRRYALRLCIEDYNHPWPNEDAETRKHRVSLLHTLVSAEKGDDTNLIVLTREELIAEIEKMPCGCSRSLNNSNPHSAFVQVNKCHRCQWLARVKAS